jgi:hypothetical protein
MKSRITYALMFFLMIQIVSAASTIELSLDSVIIQGNSKTASFTITSDSRFNGTVLLAYKNFMSSDPSSVVFSDEDFSLSGSDYVYTYEFSVRGDEVGSYTLYANLTDESSSLLDTTSISGTVNSSAPRIISKAPTGVVTSSSTQLQVSTNENSICKFSTTANTTYSSLSNTFEVTGEKSHSNILTGLDESTHNYYVMCKDTVGYEMNESVNINFVVDLAPSAEIEMEDSSPIKAGTIKITLTTSESLTQTPQLEYSFDSAPTSKKLVSLTGSTTEWIGYMIIDDDNDNKVGTFYFSGKDSRGTTGNEITEGKTFIVDTKNPDAPLSLTSKSIDDQEIELKWYYDGEEIDHFNIYRKTTSGVNFIDFYTETANTTSYIDTTTEDKVTYYYKVAAVDMARNIGTLSEEVYATAIDDITDSTESTDSTTTQSTTQQSTDTPKLLPPNLVLKVNDEIKRIEKLMIDIAQILKDFENNDEKQILNDLNLKNTVSEAKTKLDNIKYDLDNLKLEYRSESQLNSELSIIELERKRIQQTTPKKLKVIEKSNSIQSLDETQIDLAIDVLFLNYDFKDIDKKKYAKQIKKIQENIEVEQIFYVIEIEYIDGTALTKTLFSKILKYRSSDKLSDIIIFELIPDYVIENLNGIDFINKNFELIEKSNMVKFGLSRLDFEGEELKYIIKGKEDINDAKDTTTVVLVGPIALKQSLDQVTGFSISDLFSSKFGIKRNEIYFILLGIIVMGLLTSYQIFITRDPNTDLKIMDKIKDKFQGLKNTQTNSNDLILATQLIKWINNHIENNEHERARILYDRINDLYKTMSKIDKSTILDDCVLISSKIKL